MLRPVAILMALLAAAPALAHQQKEAVTRVLFNDRTGNIEVMHRFLLHDAEHAGRAVLGASVDLLGSSADRDRFEDYVHSQFAMLDQDGSAIVLVPVGNEIDDRFIWVYAEAPIPESLTGLTLTHDALRDLWPEQINLVNVERDGEVRSAVFREGSGSIDIRFEANAVRAPD